MDANTTPEASHVHGLASDTNSDTGLAGVQFDFMMNQSEFEEYRWVYQHSFQCYLTGQTPSRVSMSRDAFPSGVHVNMADPINPPKIELVTTPEYRESYANSVQVRVNLWDFFLLFGTLNQTAPDAVSIRNFQGIYLSPQQSKALLNVLQQNITQYEAAFGEIRLEPQQPSGGSIQ